MAVGDVYCTEAEFNKHIGINDVLDSVVVDAAILAASRWVDTFCHRVFYNTTTATTRTYLIPARDVLYVHDFYTLTDLAIADTATPLTADEYQLEPYNGIGPDGSPGWPYTRIRRFTLSSPWWTAPTYENQATISVTARWGWATVPDPVKRATLSQAKFFYQERDARLGVVGFGQFGDVRVRGNTLAEMLLAPYVVKDRPSQPISTVPDSFGQGIDLSWT